MDKKVDQCLSLIEKDNVDQVLFSFGEAYIWLVKNKFAAENFHGVPERFLEQISQALKQRGIERQTVSEKEMRIATFRTKDAISSDIIDGFLKLLTGQDGIDFLGALIGKYALVVPEPLFRIAQSFSGIHQTPNTPPVNDSLPMTDEMILYCWQYYWFYSALGH